MRLTPETMTATYGTNTEPLPISRLFAARQMDVRCSYAAGELDAVCVLAGKPIPPMPAWLDRDAYDRGVAAGLEALALARTL